MHCRQWYLVEHPRWWRVPHFPLNIPLNIYNNCDLCCTVKCIPQVAWYKTFFQKPVLDLEFVQFRLWAKGHRISTNILKLSTPTVLCKLQVYQLTILTAIFIPNGTYWKHLELFLVLLCVPLLYYIHFLLRKFWIIILINWRFLRMFSRVSTSFIFVTNDVSSSAVFSMVCIQPVHTIMTFIMSMALDIVHEFSLQIHWLLNPPVVNRPGVNLLLQNFGRPPLTLFYIISPLYFSHHCVLYCVRREQGLHTICLRISSFLIFKINTSQTIDFSFGSKSNPSDKSLIAP